MSQDDPARTHVDAEPTAVRKLSVAAVRGDRVSPDEYARLVAEIETSLDRAEATAQATAAASGGERWSSDRAGTITVDHSGEELTDPVTGIGLPPHVAEYQHNVAGQYGVAWDPATVLADIAVWRALVDHCRDALKEPTTRPLASVQLHGIYTRWNQRRDVR